MTPLNRKRWILMLLAPGPILVGSMALSRYVRSDRPAPPSTNDVIVRGQQPEPSRVSSVAVDDSLERKCQDRGEVWQRQLGAPCEVVVAAPFVLVGDLSREELLKWHAHTIAPATNAMLARYFQAPPNEPISVLLCSSPASYEHYAEQLFGDLGVSVYGYYKPRQRALVMNISTGGGTLVHELTHALIAFDCPDVPDWFNEGFASLHEQCRFRADERGPWIQGLVNWRLAGLQAEIAAGSLPPLETLLRNDNFRGPRVAANYAQARYLCLYLQEQGLLERFYARLRTNIDDDPTGEVALKSLFPEQSWQEINADYLQFVRALMPPE